MAAADAKGKETRPHIQWHLMGLPWTSGQGKTKIHG